jgi:5-methylcytosine-specific restriction endonuclease McrA
MDNWLGSCAVPTVNLPDLIMAVSLAFVWFLLRREQITRRQQSYREYLKSEHWQEVRKEKLKEAGYKCQKCGAKESLDIHHLTYARLGHERMSDLQALCRSCHRKAGRK